MKNKSRHIALQLRNFLFLAGLLLPFFGAAQNSVRAAIDQDRRYLSYKDEKTLEKARGYIRQDSTFYIGYMYMGAFLFDRANDELGFTQGIASLEKAMRLIEKDYDTELRTRTNDIFTYIKVSNYQNDYCDITYWLEQSYQNIEEPGKAMEVLRHVRDRNLQMEQSIESYNMMAWIYHRNRMYTSTTAPKYAFLKNSVKENDSMAFKYLDSALYKIRNDASVNAGLFDASYLNRLYLYTYHYKAILFDYNLEIDSANYYYDELMRTGYYSSNNYAEFKMAMGEFQVADEYFKEAEARDGMRDKQTREYFYMRGTLDIYRGHPEEADTLLRDVLEKQGASPGFGWHCIGLSRALHYEGLSAESQERINKASNFAELHINTTWGPEQYHIACATLNYTNALQFEQEFYFENHEWEFWLNPANWVKALEYSYKTYQQKNFLAVMVAKNPERKQVIYTLFSSENLINFDEVWSLIDGFGNEYFIDFYKKLIETDKRPKVKKYFRYFLGKLYLAEGNKTEAINYFQQVLDDPDIEDSYQRLLYARTCEGMALAHSGDKDKLFWTQKVYDTFPQLLAHSDLRMRFRLEDEGQLPGTSKMWSYWAWTVLLAGFLTAGTLYVLSRSGRMQMKGIVILCAFLGFTIVAVLLFVKDHSYKNENPSSQIMNGLENCAVDFTNDYDVPSVQLEFNDAGDATEVDYKVRSADGSSIVTQGTLRVNKAETEDGGKLLAYRLFNIRKKKIGDEPLPTLPKKEKPKK